MARTAGPRASGTPGRRQAATGRSEPANGKGPTAGAIDQISEHDGRDDAGYAKAEIHHATGGPGIVWRNIHRHRPDRRHISSTKKNAAASERAATLTS